MRATTGTPILPPTRVGRPASFENFADQRRRGGLAVGAGDRQYLAFKKARGQFEFADDGQAEVARLDQFGRIERHARADDDEVLAAEGEQAVAAGLDVDPLFEEGGNVFRQRLGAAQVGDGDLGAAPAQKQGRGEAGFPQSDDENFFAFEVHHEQSNPLSADFFNCAPREARRGTG